MAYNVTLTQFVISDISINADPAQLTNNQETVKMHSVQPVKKQESAAKRRKDTHTAEKKNVYFPGYADKRHASERGEIRA